MVPAVIVVIHESPDVLFKVSGKIVVFEQDPVLQRLMPSLDLALGLRMIGSTMNVIDLLGAPPVSELCRDVVGPIATQKPQFQCLLSNNSLEITCFSFQIFDLS